MLNAEVTHDTKRLRPLVGLCQGGKKSKHKSLFPMGFHLHVFLEKANLQGQRSVKEERSLTTKGHMGSFWRDGNVPGLRCDDGYTTLYDCQNYLNRAPEKGEFHCTLN